jgi:hypothetical protein
MRKPNEKIIAWLESLGLTYLDEPGSTPDDEVCINGQLAQELYQDREKAIEIARLEGKLDGINVALIFDRRTVAAEVEKKIKKLEELKGGE